MNSALCMLSNGAGLHALPATQLEKKNLKKRSDNLVFKTSVKIGTICVFWKVDLSVLDLTSYEPHFVDTRLPSLKHFFRTTKPITMVLHANATIQWCRSTISKPHSREAASSVPGGCLPKRVPNAHRMCSQWPNHHLDELGARLARLFGEAYPKKYGECSPNAPKTFWSEWTWRAKLPQPAVVPPAVITCCEKTKQYKGHLKMPRFRAYKCLWRALKLHLKGNCVSDLGDSQGKMQGMVGQRHQGTTESSIVSRLPRHCKGAV